MASLPCVIPGLEVILWYRTLGWNRRPKGRHRHEKAFPEEVRARYGRVEMVSIVRVFLLTILE